MSAKRPLEVLAPAGSPQALDAAVACGADAVYLGVDLFNARRNAENFTLDNLADTVRRCHIQGVKVYLTLNIVLLESEIPLFLRTAQAACAAGVDAVIVQDLGAADLLRRCAPGLRLNASTQMAVHNLDGVRLLEELGFSRVVLARECSREEIAAICASTSMEVEVFVHGALCMSVSGQCYMSSILGQRSGNRGLCAQPCRLNFQSRATEHALSLKDMSLISRVEELRAAGVTSLKIEGRMKRPEYVAAAVTACRTAVAGGAPDLESLQAVFSRSGFTDGYFTGERTLEMFGIRGKEDVLAASAVLGKLGNLYNEPRNHIQKVGVKLQFEMKADVPTQLTVSDCAQNAVRVEGAVPQIALNKPTDSERAAASLGKTGGTPYRVEGVDCSIDDGLMLPASALNALRRTALEALDDLRGAVRAIPFDGSAVGELVGRASASKPALRVRAWQLEQISPEMWERAELITLPVEELERLWAGGTPAHADKLCAGVPRMRFGAADALRERLDRLGDRGLLHTSVGNLGALHLASELGFILHGEPFFNAVNSYAVRRLADWDLRDLTLSFELNLESAKRLVSPIPLGVYAYGRLPLMTVRNCPIKVSVGCARCKRGENLLIDRQENKLPVSCVWGCSEILNPLPLYLGDRLAELDNLDFLVMDFSTESPEECAKLFANYQVGEPPRGKFTRGLSYKALL